MIEVLIAVGIVLIVSGFCSLAEAALYSIPEAYVELLHSEGASSGKVLKKLRSNMRPTIAAILTLNTIANTAGAAVAGAAAVSAWGEGSFIVFSAAFTISVLLFAEIIPKTLGVSHCKFIAFWLARPIAFLTWVMTPCIIACDLITRLFAKEKDAAPPSIDEIEALADIAQRKGSLEGYEHKFISNILDLREKNANDIMTPRTVVETLKCTMTVQEAASALVKHSHSRIPIWNANHEDYIGVVHQRDLMSAVFNDETEKLLKEIKHPIHFVPGSIKVSKLLEEFIFRHTHLFAVLDEYGGIDGIITLEDVLEEIVGSEIVDEFDVAIDMQELAREKRSHKN